MHAAKVALCAVVVSVLLAGFAVAAFIETLLRGRAVLSDCGQEDES